MFPTVSISISLKDLINISSWTKKKYYDQLRLYSSASEIILKKFHFPKHLIKEDINKITCGYKLDTHNFEVTIASNFLSIATPTMGEMQLFYFFSNDHFFASDSFAHLISLIPQELMPPLDVEGVINFLSLDFKLDERTLFSGIKLLRENSKLKINNNQLEVSVLLDWKEIITLGSSTYTLDSAVKLFEKRLSESIDSTLKNYQGKVASTLSGGIDSSLISAALINKQGKDTLLCTIAFTEPDRTYQEKRVNDFINRFGGELNIIDILKTSLLSEDGNTYLLDPYIDPYAQSIIKLSEKSFSNNNFIILNGHGGDHLFNQLNKETTSSYKKDISHFFSKSAQQFLFKKNNSKKSIASIISGSISKTLFSNYPCWRSVGIWPHAPLLTPEIISMSHLLPARLRQNKIVITEYMKRNDFPHSVLSSYNPNYASFFNNQISKISKNKIKKIIKESTPNKMGLINYNHIEQTLSKKSIDKKHKKRLHQLLYATIRLELFLKSISKGDSYA